jgi:cytochrome c-type biogenesis protein CcmE
MIALRRGSSRSLILGGIAIIAVVFGYLLYGGLDKNVVYFLTPKELLAKGTNGVDVPVRLGGQIKPGSVKWNDATLDLRFTITDGTSDIAVASKGAPPQMFRDGMGVVVEGATHDGVFNSTNLIVKHWNEYRPPKPGDAQACTRHSSNRVGIVNGTWGAARCSCRSCSHAGIIACRRRARSRDWIASRTERSWRMLGGLRR